MPHNPTAAPPLHGDPVHGLPDHARRAITLAAISAAIAVAAGAFGAHALRDRVEPLLLEVFETGARYQMYHALGLIAVAMLLTIGPRTLPTAPPAAGTRLAVASGRCFVAGTVLFSGSLYAMTFTGIRALGAITPLGGLCFIAGWLCLAAAAIRAE